MRKIVTRVSVVAVAVAATLAFAAPAWADTTFVVNSTGDGADAVANAVCDVDTGTDGDQCTLRAAIEEANGTAGSDTIRFDVGGGGPQTINVAGSELTVTGPAVVDGTTQPGFSGAPLIRLVGTDATSTSGLSLSSHTGSTVRGLMITGFDGSGVNISGGGSHVIAGNFVGTDGEADLGNGGSGVLVDGATRGVTIGGTIDADRNVLSGNAADGVRVEGGAGGNAVRGNYVGTKANGTEVLANGERGIFLNGSPNNTVGGTVAAARNVVHGGSSDGVRIAGTAADGNRVQGNYLGVDKDGDTGFGGAGGVRISGAPNTLVGGPTGSARNVISGHRFAGIRVDNAGAANTRIQGNYIGTDGGGTAAVANGIGIQFQVVSGATIGGTTSSTRNVISGNRSPGIQIVGGSNNAVQGNYIGTDADGTAAVANGNGIDVLAGATQNTIGGTADGARNVISGNASQGIYLLGPTTRENSVIGNFIGTNANGTTDLGNGSTGVLIADSPDNEVGGIEPGSGNVISGNGQSGVYVGGADATGNTVRGNLLGTNAAGTSAVTNLFGITLYVDASNNRIGGTSDAARNVISGNVVGINVNVGASNNIIQNNRIGTDASGERALGNWAHGVNIGHSSSDNLIGGPAGTGNTIAHNLDRGVRVTGANSGNAIRSNAVFSNAHLGIDLAGGTQNAADVTANDPNDADLGPNNLQNYPVIVSAVRDATADTTTVWGTLDSTPSTAFDLDFFASSAADPSGNGEGERYLDTRSVRTNSNGDASFSFTFNGALPLGEVVTATATDPGNNTSEFSRAQKVDAPGALGFSEDSYTVSENGTEATIEVRRTDGGAGLVSVDYATVDGTAKAGEDYTNTGGTLTFADGDTTETFAVPVSDDARDEPDETLDLRLSSPTGGATLAARDASRATISDDDGEPAISIDDATVTEGDAGTTDALFTVRLSGPSGREVSVDYATDDGTASAGRDYGQRGGRITFAPGDTEKTIPVPVDGDALDEDRESFFVNLSGAQNASVSDNRAVGTITDDDAGARPSLSVRNVTVTEGDSGAVNATFRVTLSGASGRTVAVDYATSNATARAGSDYAARGGRITFAPDETTRTVTVVVNGDTLDEKNEAFSFNLVDPSWATLANGWATGTIKDNDTAPTVVGVRPKGKRVPPQQKIAATFSEAMNWATFNAAKTFKLFEKGTTKPLAATLSYPAPGGVILDPNRPLKREETYRVVIVGGAAGVKDAQGTALATNKVWEFTVR